MTVFKQRILDANFLFFKTNFDRVNNSITSYAINESYYKFNEIMSKISDSSKTQKEDKVNNYVRKFIYHLSLLNKMFPLD